MSPLNWKVMTLSLGLFTSLTFVVCVIYGLVMPPALHMAQFLEITLPGSCTEPMRVWRSQVLQRYYSPDSVCRCWPAAREADLCS
jgi:hypothetical protein